MPTPVATNNISPATSTPLNLFFVFIVLVSFK